MKNPFLLHSTADAAGVGPSQPVLHRKSAGAFNRAVAAQLEEIVAIGEAAQSAPFAQILADDYEISADFVAEMLTKAHTAQEKFGLASTSSSGGKADTAKKQAAEDALVFALRKIQTGAKLTFPDSRAQQEKFYVGTRLEEAEDQLSLIAQTVLQELETTTLKSVTPAKIAAVREALAAWDAITATQGNTKLGGQTDRAQGQALLKTAAAMSRQIKIAIDGEFPYDGHDENGAPFTTTRKRFHIPEYQPYSYTPRSE